MNAARSLAPSLLCAALLIPASFAIGDPEPSAPMPSAEVPEEVSLQYKLQPGQAMRLKMTGKTSFQGLIDGRSATDHVRGTVKLSLTSKCLGERDGFWTLTQTSDAPVITATARGRGYGMEIRGGKKIVRYKGKVLPPEQVPPQLAKIAIPKPLRDHQVRVDCFGNVPEGSSGVVDGMPRLPEQLLRVGDGWSTESQQKDARGGRSPLVTHHTLKSLERRNGRLMAIIESEAVSMSRNGADGADTQHHMTILFDVDAGYVQSLNSQMQVSIQKPLVLTKRARPRAVSRKARPPAVPTGRLDTQIDLTVTQTPIPATPASEATAKR